MPEFVGAVDQGTTSTRFMIFDHAGREVARHQLEHEQILPKAGWVEHDPVEIWERASSVLTSVLNRAKLTENIDRSVMMVTALSPVIGYDKAAAISYYAIDHNLTLKQAALANGVSEELYDQVVNPLALTRGGSADLPSGPAG